MNKKAIALKKAQYAIKLAKAKVAEDINKIRQAEAYVKKVASDEEEDALLGKIMSIGDFLKANPNKGLLIGNQVVSVDSHSSDGSVALVFSHKEGFNHPAGEPISDIPVSLDWIETRGTVAVDHGGTGLVFVDLNDEGFFFLCEEAYEEKYPIVDVSPDFD